MSKKRANGKLFWNISWKAEQSYKSQLIRDPIHPHITLLSFDHLYFQSQLNPCILHQYLYYKFPPLIFLFFYYNFLYYKTHMIIILFLKQNVFFYVLKYIYTWSIWFSISQGEREKLLCFHYNQLNPASIKAQIPRADLGKEYKILGDQYCRYMNPFIKGLV